jgi:hypothetical protein
MIKLAKGSYLIPCLCSTYINTQISVLLYLSTYIPICMSTYSCFSLTKCKRTTELRDFVFTYQPVAGGEVQLRFKKTSWGHGRDAHEAHQDTANYNIPNL